MHQNYELFETRLSSFANWPKERLIPGRRLALAGFFYSGKQDWVYCFNCDMGLINFDHDVEPEALHALFYDKCAYLNNIM